MVPGDGPSPGKYTHEEVKTLVGDIRELKYEDEVGDTMSNLDFLSCHSGKHPSALSKADPSRVIILSRRGQVI